MNQLNNVKAILEEDVDRKEFLQYVGIGILGAVGITSVLKNLDEIFRSRRSGSNNAERASGYGSSAYGG